MATGATYLERKHAGVTADVCTYSGCKLAPADDSLMCPTHRDAARSRVRTSMQKARADWRSRKRCGRCGRPRVPGRKHCAACLIALGRTPHREVNNHVNKRDRVAARITVGTWAKEEGRSRYRGALGRKGGPGKAREDAEDLSDARESIDKAMAGLAYARSDEVRALPLAQRQEALDAALSQADHGARFIEDVLARNRYGGRTKKKKDAG